MLVLRENVELRPFNTLGVPGQARWFAELHADDEAAEASAAAVRLGVPLQVIGGGSNLLLGGDLEALVLRVASRGIRVLADDGETVILEGEAGEPWHPFVEHSLQRGLAGLENLSLIPGTVGAAPVQNIGAYGVEVKDVLAGVTAWDLRQGGLRDFAAEDCAFGYRESRFKQEPGRWLILRVRFRLRRTPCLHLDYGPVRERLAAQGIERPTPADVSRAVCAIRREKLPDPAVLGNAGSFFKNPVVPAALVERLRARYPQLVAYPQADGGYKLAAGWLIEQAGWKGFREGDAGVHARQALVLVNHGQARGEQILALAERIRADIQARFGVCLEMEPVRL